MLSVDSFNISPIDAVISHHDILREQLEVAEASNELFALDTSNEFLKTIWEGIKKFVKMVFDFVKRFINWIFGKTESSSKRYEDYEKEANKALKDARDKLYRKMDVKLGRGAGMTKFLMGEQSYEDYYKELKASGYFEELKKNDIEIKALMPKDVKKTTIRPDIKKSIEKLIKSDKHLNEDKVLDLLYRDTALACDELTMLGYAFGYTPHDPAIRIAYGLENYLKKLTDKNTGYFKFIIDMGKSISSVLHNYTIKDGRIESKGYREMKPPPGRTIGLQGVFLQLLRDAVEEGYGDGSDDYPTTGLPVITGSESRRLLQRVDGAIVRRGCLDEGKVGLRTHNLDSYMREGNGVFYATYNGLGHTDTYYGFGVFAGIHTPNLSAHEKKLASRSHKFWLTEMIIAVRGTNTSEFTEVSARGASTLCLKTHYIIDESKFKNLPQQLNLEALRYMVKLLNEYLPIYKKNQEEVEELIEIYLDELYTCIDDEESIIPIIKTMTNEMSRLHYEVTNNVLKGLNNIVDLVTRIIDNVEAYGAVELSKFSKSNGIWI